TPPAGPDVGPRG
uniref:Bradykinin inhibitor peptide n=4 Tax=Crotalinae TaxID=8710 RepID=BKIP_AGKBI